MARHENPFVAYLAALKETSVHEKTEHTDRDVIKALLQHIAPSGVAVVHEPKRVPGKGAPDFKILQNGQIIGYVETKPIGTDLNSVAKSEQIERYKTLSKNILLTDYLNLIWIKDDVIQQDQICLPTDLYRHKVNLDEKRISHLETIISGFLSFPPQQISRAHHLADALATRGRLLRDFLRDELERQESKDRENTCTGSILRSKNKCPKISPYPSSRTRSPKPYRTDYSSPN